MGIDQVHTVFVHAWGVASAVSDTVRVSGMCHVASHSSCISCGVLSLVSLVLCPLARVVSYMLQCDVARVVSYMLYSVMLHESCPTCYTV